MVPFNILFSEIKVWSLGKTEQKLFPSPRNHNKTALITPFSPHKNREVVGAEAFKFESLAPKTLLLFAQRCKSTFSFSNTSPIYKFISTHTCTHTRTHTYALTHTYSYSPVRHFFVFVDKL